MLPKQNTMGSIKRTRALKTKWHDSLLNDNDHELHQTTSTSTFHDSVSCKTKWQGESKPRCLKHWYSMLKRHMYSIAGGRRWHIILSVHRPDTLRDADTTRSDKLQTCFIWNYSTTWHGIRISADQLGDDSEEIDVQVAYVANQRMCQIMRCRWHTKQYVSSNTMYSLTLSSHGCIIIPSRGNCSVNTKQQTRRTPQENNINRDTARKRHVTTRRSWYNFRWTHRDSRDDLVAAIRAGQFTRSTREMVLLIISILIDNVGWE